MNSGPPITEPAADAEVIAAHGLSAEEYSLIEKRLGRAPNETELGIFSVMWSEHCSYKSSRIWLKKLPTEADWVICGPGENAGVIDIGDGQAAIFKMESHNHPSFIEPYQGAATGVGGIMRDIFTMGARPIANMNALRFGDPAHPRTRHLVSGVVAGIGGYGNCMGIPTIGGECNFHNAYNGNILVNAMTVGLADKERIFYSAAAGIGHPVVYVGSKTGRDGIHGATMASAEFDANSEEKRPTVQVGDPFTEKLVLEACLELMATDAILAIQDMGAAGLTCSSVEMVSKGGTGIELDLDCVPTREEGMTPYEIMLSESQERMLMVLKPGSEGAARKIFEKWELDFAIVGRITDSGRMVLKSGNNIVADLPVGPLVDDAPIYDRPYERRERPEPISAVELNASDVAPLSALRTLLGAPDLCAKRWIWEQYDHMVMADTIVRPGGDAGVVRVHGSNKGLAISTDCTPRYCAAHPESGGAQAVAETWRNLTAVGATPLAITDCLNFGNPERPEVMGQFVGCIEGMAKACRALDYPVISGNVSFYNETEGVGILPTPAIGGVGLIANIDRMARIAFAESGEQILLIGETKGHLDASIYAREMLGREDGPPPPVDLAVERRNGEFVRGLIEAGRVRTCHDISDGGLLVAVAEMSLAALAEGREIGATIDIPDSEIPLHAWLFGEDQARYVVSAGAAQAKTIINDAIGANIPIYSIGLSGGATLTLGGTGAISLNELQRAHEDWLPHYMEAPDGPVSSGE
ncbi:MAG: phosphoribosylformylglycinamidine synthase subunit PurL [Proteobacteria bacterium]|nr:phosphoribosylformylglycinamidine synthase subunit PurL [Pseudomonadota bacterium]MDA1356288.1 phosphoribosylformylglycinamidine synthase subunit PurL [Pseudomonadota bacterium]